MNSYPHEFLAHPQPLMFVAGLLAPASRDRSLSTASAGAGPSSRRPSEGARTHLSPGPVENANEAITTPLTSPQGKVPSLPTSPPPGADALTSEPTSPAPIPENAIQEVKNPRDLEFDELVKNLRGALEPKGEKPRIWLPEGERKDFRIILVDKNVRLPLRKVHPNPGSSQTTSETAHSPLSPLTPTSPTYPDGLIAPVWVRKHSDLVPSVFVLFLRLHESPSSNEPLGADQAQGRIAEEREADDALIREIGERRRRLGERGIKLTVVLMASAETLGAYLQSLLLIEDSTALDSRLSYIRRASALSSKASLFVLTPVPANELPDFVQSLQEALYEAATEYYTAHTKRVRRKRSRLPSTNIGNPVGSKGLSPGGWAVRYDWKAGWFAEIRGEYEIARRHYEDCWNELARLFASTQLLPPRSKRWAEAKVLADCVAVRICRLLLYEDDPSKVLGPFFVHLKRFGDFSRGWGIGEDTFEFWSWIARQYRIFAELLELGIQSGLQIPPAHFPAFPSTVSVALPPTPDFFATPVSSANPLHTLQQPAYYFYTAAICSLQRQARFKEALDIENEAQASEAGSTSGYVATAPGFANERKVDHAALVIELFTKTYSLLKESTYPQDRVALYVAFRIAETYCMSEQYEMAMRFFDRISSSFKRDHWDPIVRQIHALWYDCAQRTGAVETAVKLLVEMIAAGASPSDEGTEEEPVALEEDLLGLLKTTSPSSSEPIVIDLSTPGTLLNFRTGFWQSSALTSETPAFQIVCSAAAGIEIGKIPWTGLHVSWSDDRADLVINPASAADSSGIVDVGLISHETWKPHTAPLVFSNGEALVIQGQLSSIGEGESSISAARLRLEEGSWNIQLVVHPEPLQEWHTPNGPVVPINELSMSTTFSSKSHDLGTEVSHHPSAYVAETLSITVTVRNDDSRDLDVTLSAFLQPSDEADGSTIAIGETINESLLENIPLGTISAGATETRIINLIAPEEGTKVIDISIHSTVNDAKGGTTEVKEKTIVIPILPPFIASSSVRYRHSAMSASVEGNEAFISSILTAPGPRKVEVESMTIRANDIEETKLLYSSLQGGESSVPNEWDSSTTFAVLSKFSVLPARRPSLAGITAEPPAHVFIRWRTDPNSEAVETRLPLPPLSLPLQNSFLSATIHSPPAASLNTPFIQSLILRNSHPSAAATDLHLQVDTAEAFVWVGNRLAKLPPVAAGEEVRLGMEVVPVGGTGWFSSPTVRVWAGEGEGRVEVSVRSAGSEAGGQTRASIFVRP